MKRNNHRMSSETQINSWWHMTLVVWLFWLLSLQRATRATSQSLGRCLMLLTFSDLLNEANSQVLQKPFPAVFELGNLDGSNGFQILGITAGDESGISVSAAGDFNGDGIGDVIIGAPGGNERMSEYSGEAYIVYGRKTFNAKLSLATLNGANGLKLTGINKGDWSGYSVADVGDVNGDGIDDVIIAAPFAHTCYLVFGKRNRSDAVINLGGLNDVTGLKLDTDSRSVAGAGDFNGDGVDDVLIGDSNAFPDGTSTAGAGYIVFGSRSGFSPNLSLKSLNGNNGFTLQGAAGDRAGLSIAGAGDINADGFDDVIIASFNNYGPIYVVFGGNSSVTATRFLASLNGENGFRLEPPIGSSFMVAAAGDINGDGIEDVVAVDMLIGGSENTNVAYVVFGKKSRFNATLVLSSLNGTNGFMVSRGNESDYNGYSLASVNDINGDGIDDVIIGAYFAGVSHVVFGSTKPFNSTLSLARLDEGTGFRISGIEEDRRIGESETVAGVGDVNGDGIADMIIGARQASPEGKKAAGVSYVIFGHNVTRQLGIDTNQFIVDHPRITKTLTTNNIRINYETGSLSLLDSLNVTISDVQYGEFKINAVSQPSPFTFKHALLSNQSVTFTHDGSDELPSYTVMVMDSRTKVGPMPVLAFVQFKNQLTLTQDELLILNSSMLSAKMTGRSLEELTYVITKPNRLDFKNSLNNTVTRFTQAEVNAGVIRLISLSPSNANAEYRPSFEFTIKVNQTDVLPQPINGNVTYYLQPVITANILNILTKGEQIVIAPQQLTVSYGQDSADDLTITIDKVIGGVFSLDNNTQSPPFQFKARVIRQNALSFTQDGSDTLPSYEVTVTDGHRTAGPTRASVTAPFAKQQPPQIINNQLSLNEGEHKLLTRNNLLAVDDTVTNPALIRYFLLIGSINHITFNHLSLNRSGIDQFSQKEINDAFIEVAHDGEDVAPTASFQVSDGELTGMTTNLNITFLANQPDAPVLKLNEVLIKQGDVIAVTTNWLMASDSDAEDTEKLIIKVISSIHGYFRKVGEDAALMEFTRADVVANHIEFVHDGSSAAPDIKLQASDGMLSSDEQTLAVKFAEAGSTNGVAIGIGSAIGVLSCVGLFAGGYAFYRKRQADLSREGSDLDLTISRIVYERLNIKGVANFTSGPGLKYVAQITEINQAYQRVNGEISDVRSYSEALAQAIKAVFSADADVISKGNSLSFNIADENKRQPLRRQCEAIVERCRNRVSEGNRELSTNNGKDIPMKTF